MWYCGVLRENHFQAVCTQEAQRFGIKFVGCVILRYISACVPYNMTVYSGKYMKHAAIWITTAAGTIIGLKMWDTNCTQTKYLLSYLMI